MPSESASPVARRKIGGWLVFAGVVGIFCVLIWWRVSKNQSVEEVRDASRQSWNELARIRTAYLTYRHAAGNASGDERRRYLVQGIDALNSLALPAIPAGASDAPEWERNVLHWIQGMARDYQSAARAEAQFEIDETGVLFGDSAKRKQVNDRLNKVEDLIVRFNKDFPQLVPNSTGR